MAKRRYRAEDSIHRLREADVLLSEAKPVAEVCRAVGVTDVTYYRRYQIQRSAVSTIGEGGIAFA